MNGLALGLLKNNMDKSKIVIIITGSQVDGWDKNWQECLFTWIPLVRQLGYHVKISFPDNNIPDYFLDEDGIIKFKCSYDKYGLFDRAVKLAFRWVLDYTDYEYYVKIDSDTFIHPTRFDNMLMENISECNFDYLGACHPYRLWNTNHNFKSYVHQNEDDIFWASGSAFIINRRIMEIAYNNLIINDEWELGCDDLVLGRAMKKLNIPLLHDNRICYESPYNEIIDKTDDFIDGTPYIGDKNSHLAIQHYMNGHMAEAINNLIK
jgi:hypothetical protein